MSTSEIVTFFYVCLSVSLFTAGVLFCTILGARQVLNWMRTGEKVERDEQTLKRMVG